MATRSSNPLSFAVAKADLTDLNLIAMRKWLQEQLSAHEHAKLGQGGHTNTRVPLQRVFIDLPVSSSVRPEAHGEDRVLFLRNLLSAKPLKLQEISGIDRDYKQLSLDGEDAPSESRRITNRAKRELRNFSASLLIGGPGQGKSTLGQLACQIHRASLLAPFSERLNTSVRELIESFTSPPEVAQDDEQWKKPSNIMLPLQVALPDFAVWLNGGEYSRQHPPALIRYICSLDSAKSSQLSAHVLAALAIRMPVLLFLDGFDEVGAAQDRERLVTAANEFLVYLSQHGGSAQIIATTRPQGYSGEFEKIGIELTTWHLLALEKDEALRYAEKLVIEKIQGVDERKQTLDRLQEAAQEPSTERLLTTPLQITILTALVQHRGRAPRERWNLFHGYFNFTYLREIERNSYASELLRDYRLHIEQIHARVGLLLQVEAEQDGGASAKLTKLRLEQVIEAVLADAGYDKDEARDNLVQDIVEAAKLRLVFLVEPEPGSFGFEIRSFQEFMCAWALTSGREQHITDRLHIISRAPMFRNVTLFSASRLFADGSHLCDIYSSRICHSLDNDEIDLPANFTKAGATLALEMLEEGAALAYPRYARDLTTCAKELFLLPPTEEHIRLVHAGPDKIRNILRNHIEEYFNGDEISSAWNPRTIWIILIELINVGENWAENIAEKHKEIMPTIKDLLSDCKNLEIIVGSWLKSEILQRTDQINPEILLGLKITRPLEKLTWIDIISAAFDRNRIWSHHRRWANGVPLRAVETTISGITLDSLIPSKWDVWCKAALFQLDPTSENLASVLADLSQDLDFIENLRLRVSWPLAACLRLVNQGGSNVELANKVRNGELGNTPEWRELESVWTGKRPLEVKFDDPILPWDINSSHPPIDMIGWWEISSFDRRPAQKILEDAAKLFHSTKIVSVKKWCAQICLTRTRIEADLVDVNEADLIEWLKLEPGMAGTLIRQPKWLSKTVWISALRSISDFPDPIFIGNFDEVFNSPIDTDALQPILSMLGHALDDDFVGLSQENKRKVASLLVDLPTDFLNSVPGIIVQTYCGTLKESDDILALKTLLHASTERNSYITSYVDILTESELPYVRICRLLESIAIASTGNNRIYASIITAFRKLFQHHTSKIGNPATWDHLALPLPRPIDKSVHEGNSNWSEDPFWISKIEIKDVCGVNHLDLEIKNIAPASGQWIVIIGPNGSGKTTLLRAVTLSLRNSTDPTIWPRNSLSLQWLRIEEEKFEKIEEASISITFGNGTFTRTKIRNAKFLRDGDASTTSIPVFAYGCRRSSALGGATGKINVGEKDGTEIASLFDESADLLHAESWLIQLEGDTKKNATSDMLYKAVTSALCELLEVEDIFVKNRSVWVKQSSKPSLKLSELSDGYLVNAGWFVDMIARWTDLATKNGINLDKDFMSKMVGFVLIDEIDIHLHPQWQLEILGRTRQLLPKMSFIITTHNPLTLVGAAAEEIFVLGNEHGVMSGHAGVANPSLLTGAEIYSQYFGISDTYPKKLGEKVHRYSFLSRFALRNDSEQEELLQLSRILIDANALPAWPVVPRKIRMAP